MIIRKAEFKCSSQFVHQCPKGEVNEYAFIGRSNVGKSSLINMLTNYNTLAKVSSTPGKTQLINHFNINDQWYLVDLPGYGYARVGQGKKERFSKLIDSYVLEREQLALIFILIDSRHEPQKNDLRFIQFVAENGIPLALVFTKADKLSKTQLDASVERYFDVLKKDWDDLPRYFITSAEKRAGRDELLDFIEQCNKDIKTKIAEERATDVAAYIEEDYIEENFSESDSPEEYFMGKDFAGEKEQ